MKKQVKQIGEAALYVGAALATRLLGEGTEHWTDTAKLPGIAPAVAGGILTLSSQVFTSRIYDSFKKTKESFSVDVNADLEKAILNAYKNSLSQIKDDIINDYKLGETGREKIFRYIFNIVDSKYDDTIDLDHTFLTPILNALKSEKIIGEMLKENEQLNPDDFLKKVIKIATPDYDKKDVKYLNDFVNVVCEKFKNYFRHYFRQELKREEKAKTVYFTHLLEGIILNTKDIKKDFSVIRDFAVQGDLKLSELLSSIKKGDDNVKKLEKILNNHQHQVDKRLDSIDKNIKELIAPYLDKQIRKKSFSTSNIYHYKYQYLNFVGRHEEMSSLWNFLADKDENKKFMWWMITAPGGMGKSRIAQRLCIMAKNYNAGFFEF
ncbi:MAG TPA: hypothetical protein VI757_03690, partial [Bacteroidia bacterium]|nr:hypothetical protein [Bacteroidia bacterium]